MEGVGIEEFSLGCIQNMSLSPVTLTQAGSAYQGHLGQLCLAWQHEEFQMGVSGYIFHPKPHTDTHGGTHVGTHILYHTYATHAHTIHFTYCTFIPHIHTPHTAYIPHIPHMHTTHTYTPHITRAICMSR